MPPHFSSKEDPVIINTYAGDDDELASSECQYRQARGYTDDVHELADKAMLALLHGIEYF